MSSFLTAVRRTSRFFQSHNRSLKIGAVGLLCFSLFNSTSAAESAKVEFNRDVRPILAEFCLSCHGADSASRAADLRLDQREGAVESGVILPGDPAASEMIRRILSDDENEIMPPPALKKEMSEEQKETLKQWIEQGAEYQLHWAFIPPTKPEIPQVSNPNWVKNEIDAFVLSRLDHENLTPTVEADRRSLARRLALDLTGMTPAPDVVNEFVADQSPDAYEKLVDRLMAEPTWGENRGRYWLDYARYADTHGIHFDNYREMWSYREWVINAYNNNMPFDQFTIENLAGDLIPNATLEQKIGSGFNRCNMTTNEGGAINEEYLVLYNRDRTETTALVWMGLTAGCAVCHTHKFDPISQQEFYELSAFFNNTTQQAMDGNVKDTPPIIAVPLLADRPRWETLPGEIATARTAVEARREVAVAEFMEWSKTVDPAIFQINEAQQQFHAPLNEEVAKTVVKVDGVDQELAFQPNLTWVDGPHGGKAPVIGDDGIGDIPTAGRFDAADPFTISAWIRVPGDLPGGAVLSNMRNGGDHRGWDLWIEGRRIGSHIINNWPENALKVVSSTDLPVDQWVHVAVSYNGSKKASGVQIYFNGVQQPVNVTADKLTETILNEFPVALGRRVYGAPAKGTALSDVRLIRSSLNQAQAQLLAQQYKFQRVAQTAPEQRDPQEQEDLFQWYLRTQDQLWQNALAAQQALEAEQKLIKDRGTVAHVMQEKPEPAMAYILNRGEYDQRLDAVTPNTPAVLPAFPEGVERNRLSFAKWLLQPNQPLTARVTVNRFWQEVFGTGIVKSSGDFGVMGDLPSHPELLDWLAIDFVEHGWDVKRLFKQIVMSSTYRQSAVASPEKRERDLENRLYSYGPRFRMDAEMVRDSALYATGILVQKIGGPSVKPYQPDNLWEVVGLNVSDTRFYTRDSGESLYRRSLYSFMKRMAPPASLEIFNAPNREFCVIRRERTNTPLQALVTLNDEQFVEAARVFAQRTLREVESDDVARINHVTQHLISRDLDSAELQIVQTSLAELRSFYSQAPDQAKELIHFGEFPPDETLNAGELAAWTMLVNQLMNLDEMLNK